MRWLDVPQDVDHLPDFEKKYSLRRIIYIIVKRESYIESVVRKNKQLNAE